MFVTAKNLLTVPNGTHTVAPNLFLKVRGTSRLYILRYTENGKRKDKSIGSVRTLTLKAAREKAMALRQNLAEGKSINAPIKTNVPMFKDFADNTLRTIAEVRQWKSPHKIDFILSAFNRYVYPLIGEVPIKDIKREHILSVLRPVWREVPTTAQRIQQFLDNIMAYAISTGYIEHNPAIWRGNLAMFLPPISKVYAQQHYSAPTLEELKDLVLVFRVSETMSYKALLFGALTATRGGEFTQAKWEEIDWDNRVWLIPSIRRKDGRTEPFRVPISTQVLEFLRTHPRKNEWLFPNNTATGAIQGMAALGSMRRLSNGRLTVHGMRSTFRDWCAAEGINDIVAEKCLMHSTGNAVVQAYQRSDLLEQRRSVMQQWADVLFNT